MNDTGTNHTDFSHAKTTGHNSKLRRASIVTFVGAGFIAFAAMTVGAPLANATKIPEATIKAECKAAHGTYHSGTGNGGHTYTTCTFKDAKGDTWTDHYNDGKYVGDTPYRTTPTPDQGSEPTNVPPVSSSPAR